MDNQHNFCKINSFSLGLAIGFAEGLYFMVFAWLGWLTGYGVQLIDQLSTVMIGYEPSLIGGIIGGALGFIDGFIFGLIVAFIYNLLSCKKA